MLQLYETVFQILAFLMVPSVKENIYLHNNVYWSAVSMLSLLEKLYGKYMLYSFSFPWKYQKVINQGNFQENESQGNENFVTKTNVT